MAPYVPNDCVQPTGNGSGSYRYRMGAISAAFVLLFSLAVAVAVLGPGILAILSSTITALLGFAATVFLISQLATEEGTTQEVSSFLSTVMRDEMATSVASILRSVHRGLIAAAVSVVLTGVGFLFAILNLVALPVLDLLAVATALVALLFAAHTSSLLLRIFQKSERTIWRGPLLRARAFALGAAALTGLTVVVALVILSGPRRIFVIDWVSFMTSVFTLYSVIDTRTAVIRTSAIASPDG